MLEFERANGFQDVSQVKISKLREGKASGHTRNKSRSLFFTANQNGFKFIFNIMNGQIPLTFLPPSSSQRGEEKILDGCSRIKYRSTYRVYISCKPWLCKKCFTYGEHKNCIGKRCTKCGSDKHTFDLCTSKHSYCRNCKMMGHRAISKQCPTLLQYVAREVRKADFPLEIFRHPEGLEMVAKSLLIL